MAGDGVAAELSSLATVLGELTGRLVRLAEGYQRAGREDLAAELWSIERALAVGGRRLARVVDQAS